MDEQLFWGCRLQEMGLAGKPLHAKNATPKKLAERIKTVLASQEMLENAKGISAEMKSQNGVENAIDAIEKLMNVGAGSLRS